MTPISSGLNVHNISNMAKKKSKEEKKNNKVYPRFSLS